MSRRAGLVVIVSILALAALPGVALAESFTLPAKEIYLTSWNIHPGGLHGCGGPNPGYCRWENFKGWYSPASFIVYRALINPNGSEQIIDYAPQIKHWQKIDTLGSSHWWLTAQVPEKPLELSDPGSYRVELRVITIPRATAKRHTTLPDSYVDGRSWWPYPYPTDLIPDSTVDWWVADFYESCPVSNPNLKMNNACWVERLAESNVKLSSKVQILEYYEITVAGPINPPASPGLGQPKLPEKSSFTIHTTDSPFNSNKGDEDIPSSSAASPMLLAGMLGAAAIGATLYVYRTSSSGSSFRAYQTKAGQARAAAWAAEKAHIARLKERYERMLAEEYAKAQRKKRLAALTAARQKRVKALQAELANVERYHTLEQKAAAMASIKSVYRDILAGDFAGLGKEVVRGMRRAAESVYKAASSVGGFVKRNVIEPVYGISDFLGSFKSRYRQYSLEYKILDSVQFHLDTAIGIGEGAYDMVAGFAALGQAGWDAANYVWRNPAVLFDRKVQRYSLALAAPGGLGLLYATDREFRNSASVFTLNAGASMWEYYTRDIESGHPGRSFGKGLFDVLTLLVPGSKVGTAGRIGKGARVAKAVKWEIKIGKAGKGNLIRVVNPYEIDVLNFWRRRGMAVGFDFSRMRATTRNKLIKQAKMVMRGPELDDAVRAIESKGVQLPRKLVWKVKDLGGVGASYNFFTDRMVATLRKPLFSNRQWSSAELYDTFLHEFGHKASGSNRVIFDGKRIPKLKDAPKVYGTWLEKKIAASKLNMAPAELWDPFMNTVKNKLLLDNPAVNKGKWFKGWEKQFKDMGLAQIVEKKSLSDINVQMLSKDSNLAYLAEMKLLYKATGASDKISAINKIVSQLDPDMVSKFSQIEKVFSKGFKSVRWIK